jgi:predicted nucleic acid-binding protein
VSVVYDAGVLVAAATDERETWADHRVRLELGELPRTTAPVVAQVSRSGHQVLLRRFLRGCETVAFSQEHAHDVGALLGRTGTSDVVDAHLIVIAAKTGSTVLTSDIDDLRSLSNQLPLPVSLRRV